MFQPLTLNQNYFQINILKEFAAKFHQHNLASEKHYTTIEITYAKTNENIREKKFKKKRFMLFQIVIFSLQKIYQTKKNNADLLKLN